MGMATCLKCGIWHHGECEEVPDVSKLPAWPLNFRPTMENQLGWVQRDRDAYRARGEGNADE